MTLDFIEQYEMMMHMWEGWNCMNGDPLKLGQNPKCNTFKWAEILKTKLDALASVMDLKFSALSDMPTPGVFEYMLQHKPEHVQVKFAITSREGEQWVQRREFNKGYPGLVCAYDDWPKNATKPGPAIRMNPLADHLGCIEAAAQHLGRVEGKDFMHMKEAFISNTRMDKDNYAAIMEDYETRYIYDVMRSYYQGIGEELKFGENFLHVCYFNRSLNFVDTKNMNSVINSFVLAPAEKR